MTSCLPLIRLEAKREHSQSDSPEGRTDFFGRISISFALHVQSEETVDFASSAAAIVMFRERLCFRGQSLLPSIASF